MQQRFGLLGTTLQHSWSPRIHEMLGSTPYELFERRPSQLKDFICKGNWKGLNVTIPYKQEVLNFVDIKSERVKRLGAANTLIRQKNGKIFAENTDYQGFLWMLERFCNTQLHATSARAALDKQKVLVCGSGGASRSIVAVLQDIGALPVVISRSGRNNYTNLASKQSDAFMIVNATPVGMFPKCPDSPLSDASFEKLTKLKAVIDIVYNPSLTGLCLQAEKQRIAFENGLGMLVAQARASAEFFLNQTIDDELVEKIETQLRRQQKNIALIGMPGVGKTTTGKQLARLLSRTFVDMDALFKKTEHICPAEFIQAYGEAAFRKKEHELLTRISAKSELVISCGGGVVTMPQNYTLLHQNSYIVLLNRDIKTLSIKNRPLSQTRGLTQLAKERNSLYNSWADIKLECRENALRTAQKLKALLNLSPCDAPSAN